MFYDIKDFPFLENIVANTDLLALELESKMNLPFMANFFATTLPDLNSHTEHWIRENGLEAEQAGYDARNGSWASFPLYKKGFPIKWYDVNTEFPETISLINSIPKVNFAAFFKITPGSGTQEHVHLESNLIFHLCLSDVGGESVITCNGKNKIIKQKGDFCLFDYSLPHSSFNYGKKDRINLIIDFNRPRV
jgi:aspartyl/asparaginyl beta-hydroxylase (cupin superfamily)